MNKEKKLLENLIQTNIENDIKWKNKLITNSKINSIYDQAMNCGALGGKLLGAGGGGFLLMYMKKKDRAIIIQEKLDRLYPKTPVPLNHKNNFELLIAVLLSAQTTDERVNKVTPNLFQEANTAEKMHKLHYKTIHKFIKTCGLAPKKSRAILALSKILVK